MLLKRKQHTRCAFATFTAVVGYVSLVFKLWRQSFGSTQGCGALPQSLPQERTLISRHGCDGRDGIFQGQALPVLIKSSHVLACQASTRRREGLKVLVEAACCSMLICCLVSPHPARTLRARPAFVVLPLSPSAEQPAAASMPWTAATPDNFRHGMYRSASKKREAPTKQNS